MWLMFNSSNKKGQVNLEFKDLFLLENDRMIELGRVVSLEDFSTKSQLIIPGAETWLAPRASHKN